MTLKDQRVVIIGGSSGIGLATARLAIEQGAQVTIAARGGERLEAAGRELPDARTVAVDILKEEDIAALVEGEEYIDHLVSTTGARAGGRLEAVKMDAARLAFDTKFWGPMMAVRHAAPKLRQSVVLTAGAAAWTPSRGSLVTSSVNGAVVALGRALAVDLAPIRVNVVSPGLIDTPTWAGMAEADREAMYARTSASNPVGRVGRAEEVAEAIVFLLRSGFTTGSTLHIEGGARLAR